MAPVVRALTWIGQEVPCCCRSVVPGPEKNWAPTRSLNSIQPRSRVISVSAATCVLFMALKSEVYSALIGRWSRQQFGSSRHSCDDGTHINNPFFFRSSAAEGSPFLFPHFLRDFLSKGLAKRDQNSRKASIEVNRRLLIDMLISFPWFWVNPPLIFNLLLANFGPRSGHADYHLGWRHGQPIYVTHRVYYLCTKERLLSAFGVW